jgi:transcriptional regulator with XRE-family HTH domain
MSSLERGENNVSLATLHKIAQGLQISLSELLKGLD